MNLKQELNDQYKDFSLIGKGGYSEVFSATDKANNTKVAIKIIQKNMGINTAVFPYYHEVEILNRLHHANIPKIHLFIDKESYCILVMDYIEGNTISKCLQDNRPWTEETVIDITSQLISALNYIHSEGYIYCDLKPSNIIIQPNGKIMLIDFGTIQSIHNLSHVCLGTKGFAAPEQYSEKFDNRVDIYAFGATLFYMLTGISPAINTISSFNIREINPTVSFAMENIISKCTQVSPDKRYQSFEDISQAINNLSKIRHKLNIKYFIKKFFESVRRRFGYHFYNAKKQKELYNRRKIEVNFSSIPPITDWDKTVILTNEEYYQYIPSSILDNHNIHVFLSYCHHDSDLADIICNTLSSYSFISISRYTTDVPYKGSFNEFINTLGTHDKVIMIISDMYLKSQACMYEVGQLINSPNFKSKILFIVCSNEDKKYYKVTPDQNIEAKIYDQHDRNQYILFWEKKREVLENDLKKIKNECAKIETLKVLRNINQIISKDMGLFMEYLSDTSGISFTTLEQHNFDEFLKELDIK